MIGEATVRGEAKAVGTPEKVVIAPTRTALHGIGRFILYSLIGFTLVAMTTTSEYWAPALTFPAFALITSSSQIRPTLREVLSPRGSLFWVGWATNILIPTLILLFGFSQGQLPYLTPTSLINAASLVIIGVFALAAISFQLTGIAIKPKNRPQFAVESARIPVNIAVAFIAIGITASLIRLYELGGPTSYYSAILQGQGDPAMFTRPMGSVMTLLTAFGPPFAVIGIVALWSNDELKNRCTPARRFTYIALAILPTTVYSYNRAAILTTALALITATAFFRPVRRITILFGTAAVLLVATKFGQNRNSLINSDWIQGDHEIVDLLQVYLGGPQFLSFGLNIPIEGFNPSLIIGSILAPLPGIGEVFRANSASMIFNFNVYEGYAARDQVVPMIAETRWSLTALGVALVAVALGVVLKRLQTSYDNATTIVEVFVVSIVAMWCAALLFMSVQSVSQIFVYFFPPYILMYLLIKRRKRANSYLPATPTA